MRRDVLIFSTADWDNPFWTNKQHIAVQFARHGWRVLYVDSLGLRRPFLSGRDARRMLRRLGKAVPVLREVHPNIWRVSPLVLPLHDSNLVRELNAVLLRATLRLHMARLGMEQPLIWTYNPVIADLCAALPRCGLVYHCVDDLAAVPRIDVAVIREGERRLGGIADVCFTTSPLL
jgi:hypothetical protein